MDSALLRAAQELGLNEKEAKVYMALAELGRADVTDIARHAELGRSNIYVLLEKLINQGIVHQVDGLKVNHYEAIEPRLLLQRAKSKVQNFQDMLPLFEAVYNRPQHKPRIQYYEGKEAVLNAFKDIYRFRGEPVKYIACTQRLREYIPDEVDYWVQMHKKNKGSLPGQHLLADTPADREFAKAVKDYNQECRFLPKGKTFDMDFSLFGHSVIITAIGEPFYAIHHDSQPIADSFTMMFDMLWENAKK